MTFDLDLSGISSSGFGRSLDPSGAADAAAQLRPGCSLANGSFDFSAPPTGGPVSALGVGVGGASTSFWGFGVSSVSVLPSAFASQDGASGTGAVQAGTKTDGVTFGTGTPDQAPAEPASNISIQPSSFDFSLWF